MSLLAKRRNKARFAKARRAAGEDGMVCGYTDENGEPQYVVVPKGASDGEIRRAIFEHRHGRPMAPSEELLDAFMAGDLVREYEDVLRTYIDQGREDLSRERQRLERLLEEMKRAASG